MYVEFPSPDYMDATFELESLYVYLTRQVNYALQFAYHMYGPLTGAFEVVIGSNVSSVMTWAVVWSAEGDQDSSWHDASLTGE